MSRMWFVRGALCACVALAAGPGVASPALGVFELEGNAIEQPTPGVDGEQVYRSFLEKARLGITEPVFVTDGVGSGEEIFSGGGAKDTSDISAGNTTSGAWGHSTGTTPDKDDILHAFATAFSSTACISDAECAPGVACVSGACERPNIILNFGADRLSTGGDASLGFWFFQDDVKLGANGRFEGEHKVGDILILSAFVGGGSVSEVGVYRWVAGSCTSNAECLDYCLPGDPRCGLTCTGSGSNGLRYCEGSDGPLDEVTTSHADCATAPAGTSSNACATTNAGRCITSGGKGICSATGTSCRRDADCQNNIVAPWPYAPKSAPVCSSNADCPDGACTGGKCAASGIIPTGAYFEGGVNLTALLSGEMGCFTTFMAETRSSASTDAVLKDFAIGEFGLCALSVDEEGPVRGTVGEEVHYTITVTNAGGVPLYKESIVDSFFGDVTDASVADPRLLDFTSDCGAVLAAGASCTIEFDYVIEADDPDPIVSEATIVYNGESTMTGAVIERADGHTTDVFHPGVSVTKSGTSLSESGGEVIYDFTITNTSSADTPNLVLDGIDDANLGSLTGTARLAGCDDLAPGESCTFSVNYTVPAGAADPLSGDVTVEYHPSGLPDDPVSATDGHEVNLFQASVGVNVTSETLSRVGGTITYAFTITNGSSSDTPALQLDAASDTLLGDLGGAANVAGCGSLASGASCSFSVIHTVSPLDPDPLADTVAVHYHPLGFGSDVHASDSNTVEIFQPSVGVEITGPALSQLGATATYTITITNSGSSDGTDLLLDAASDTLLGDLTAAATAGGCATLGAGASCTFEVSRLVAAGDPDPLEGTITVHYQPTGFSVDVTASDRHSTNLFQPSVAVEVTGATLARTDDVVTYEYRITNTSSADTPDLVLVRLTDTLLGDLAGHASSCTPLAVGASCTFAVNRTVLATDPDPLVNEVYVDYHPEGFYGDYTDDTDDHAVDLFQPAVAVTVGGPGLSMVGETVTYAITITNTSRAGSPDLVLDGAEDSLLGSLTSASAAGGCARLAAGASCSFTVPYVVPGGACASLVNELAVHFHADGFPTRDITDTDGHTVELFEPSLLVDVSGTPVGRVGEEATYSYTLANTGSADGPALVLVEITDTLLGDLAAVAAANGCSTLAPGASCSFSLRRFVQVGDPDPVVDSVVARFQTSGFAVQVTDGDDHAINLYAPASCAP